LDKISDTFYQSPYKGDCNGRIAPTEEEINVANLGENNPILFSEVVDLWEDELGDNGLTMSEFRFRAMSDCWFGLLR
jgi:hypothetical protein